MDYDALGDVIQALNSIDQARSQFPRNSENWTQLGYIYDALDSIEIDQIPDYSFRSPDFSYSLRCILCQNEEEHTAEQHYILASGIKVVQA